MAGTTESGSTGRNWVNLFYDPLLKIFMMLNVMDLLSASRVCSSWRQVSRDSSLWNTLDVSELNPPLCNFQEPNTWSEKDSVARFMRTLNRALNLRGGTISRLILHVYISNEHFIWVAKRTPNLKQLILPSWHMFTVKAFDQAVQNWKGLESLTVPCLYFQGEFIKSIGNHAKNFFELKVMRGFDIDFALYVACYTPRLKVLSLQATTVDKEGLEYILDNMKDLEMVNICHSLLMVDPDRPDYYSEHKVDKVILQKAAHLKEFLYCKTDSCLMCKSMIEPCGLWCVSYSSRAWREDEISWLAC